jgi:hypothetical protein
VGLNKISKAGILSHISHTSYLDGSLDDLNNFVKPPKPLLLKGGVDDIVEFDMRLSHEVYCSNDVYTSPIQAWIEESCSAACHFLHEIDHAYGFMFYSNQSYGDSKMYVLTFDVSLLWFITKHKKSWH